jgi:uncharacterized protein (DUF58 family)
MFARLAGESPDVHLLVYPRPIPYATRSDEVEHTAGWSGPVQSVVDGVFEDDTGADVGGLRPFATGDRMHLVHWRSSQRLGRLHVREAEGDNGQAALLVVDLRGQTCGSVPYEEVLSIAAGAGLSLFAQRWSVALRILQDAIPGRTMEIANPAELFGQLAMAGPDLFGSVGYRAKDGFAEVGGRVVADEREPRHRVRVLVGSHSRLRR